MSDSRLDVQKRQLFRRTNVCKSLTKCGQVLTKSHDLNIAATIFAISSIGGTILLSTLIPVRVGICCILLFTTAASVMYITFILSRSYIHEKGLISLLPNYIRMPLRELLLETSCMDLINGAHASGGFERASDFVVSLTLPLTPSERHKVIKRLSKPTQDALYREGLIHFLPKEVQTALFPEVLFKRDLPDALADGGDSESVQSENLLRRESLLTQENLRVHDRRHSDSQDGYDVSPTHLLPNSHPSTFQRSNSVFSRTSSVGSRMTNKRTVPIFGGLLDRKMNEMAYAVGRNMAQKPFVNLSDRELVYIASGCGALSCYIVIRSPRLKKVFQRSAFYVFIFVLLTAGGGAFVELLFRSRRLRKKLFQKLRLMSQLFRYSLRAITGTAKGSQDQRDMEEIN